MKKIRVIVPIFAVLLISSLWIVIFSDSKTSSVKAQESSGTTVTDLNGDGKDDTIKYTVKDLNTCTLTVNNVSITHTGFNPGNSISIIDIDKKDKYKEIVITDNKSDNANSSYYYFYNGRKIIYMGEVDGNNMVYPGEGRFTSEMRASTLQTWYYTANFKINRKHKIVFIPKSLYKLGITKIVKKPVSLQLSQTNGATAVRLKVGEKVTILYGDAKKWFLIKNSKNVKGWLAVENDTEIAGTRYNSWDVFDNINSND